MAYNNNYYGGNPYNAYGSAYNQQMQQQAQYTQPSNYPNAMYGNVNPQVQNIQQIPLVLVSSRQEAEKYILNLNQTIYFKDTTSPDLMYIKSCDSQGVVSFKPKKLVDFTEENTNQNMFQTNTTEYASKNDLKALETLFDSKLDKLSSKLEKASKNVYNGSNNGSRTKESD